MPIVVTCPACGSRFQAPDNLAGRRGKCPKCGTALEVPAARSTAPAANETALTAGERLSPCPDCGQPISRRATQCPHCGCPATVAAAPTPRPKMSQPAFAAKPAAETPSRRWLMTLLGGGLVLAVMVVLAGVLIWKLSSAPAPVAVEPPPVVPAPAPVPQVSAEQKEAWMTSVAQESARYIDSLYQQLHAGKAMIGQAQQASDLMQTLAKTGDLSKLPMDAAPAAPPAYQSQLEPLVQECSGYLRSHLPTGDYGVEKVREAAAVWVKEKEAPAR